LPAFPNIIEAGRDSTRFPKPRSNQRILEVMLAKINRLTDASVTSSRFASIAVDSAYFCWSSRKPISNMHISTISDLY
jgi:hypothetical protein